MASRDEIVSQMIQTLRVTDPELDTSIGSVTRKILDAVAQPVADAYIDQHLLAYQYDIDSKIDADLDSFCQLFGIARFAPKRATGVVTFYRDQTSADRAVTILYATQVSSTTEPIQIVQTVTTGFMPVGVLSIQVPVQAVEAGPAGNISAGLLTAILTPADPSIRVSNVAALTGGTPREGDSELRERWRRTVFRSLAGTEPMYLGIALDDPDCSQANVVGASKVHSEQVQIKGGFAFSEIDDLRYIYPGTVSVGPNLGAGVLLVEGRDYTFDTTTRPPQLSMRASTYDSGDVEPVTGTPIRLATEGAVFDLRFEYAPDATRNRPQAGITNRIDVWCNGQRAQSAQQTVLFSTTLRFNNFAASPYYLGNYERQNGRRPVAGNIFIPLTFGPIISVPPVLQIGTGEPFVENKDYWIVHDMSEDGLTSRSKFGLEWRQDRLPAGADNYFTVGLNGDYIYNTVPRDIQSNIDRWRLVGTDARAHQAKFQRLRFSLAIMYSERSNQNSTISQISQAIDRYMRSLGFNSTVQASDVLTAVGAVPGVDNVRFLDGNDYANFDGADRDNYNIGIQRVVDGRVVESFVDPTTGRVRDKTFGDSEIPVFDSLGHEFGTGRPSLRAQNTFYGRGPGMVVQPTTPTTPIDDPTSAPVLSGTATDLSNISLSWTTVPGALGYTLYFNGTRFASFGPANGTPVATSYDTSAGGVYDYTVKAYTAHQGDVDAATYGPASNVWRPSL